MRIILDNINYKGRHFNRFEAEFPQLNNLEDIPEGKLMEYICEGLDEYLEYVKEEKAH